MPRRNTHKVIGPRSYARHIDALPLAPALQEVLEEGNPELFQAVATAAMRARAAGQDVTDPGVITMIVALCRVALTEKAAS